MTSLPVFLLTGFLGSGKTTLLSKLLRAPSFADTAVVVNELGEVGLDHALIDRGSEDGVVLLDSGCLCCALGNSLQETLEDLYYRRERGELPPFARVVVETTGVADPGPIAATLGLDRSIARHYRLGAIVTTVDAVHAHDQLERFSEAARQVAYADRVIVTKVDVATREAVESLKAKVAGINPHAVQMQAIAGDVRASDVLVEGLEVADEHLHPPEDNCSIDPAHAHDHVAASGIATTTIRLEAPLDWPRYAAWVEWTQREVGAGLLRMKGVVRMEDGAAYVLHAVMRLFSAPAEIAEMPRQFGDGVVMLITQNLAAGALDEARRRLLA